MLKIPQTSSNPQVEKLAVMFFSFLLPQVERLAVMGFIHFFYYKSKDLR